MLGIPMKAAWALWNPPPTDIAAVTATSHLEITRIN
jgi:hypothetical protein